MKLDSIIEKAAQVKGKTVAVAAAEDRTVMKAVAGALRQNLAKFLLFGDKDKILEIIDEFDGIDINGSLQIIHTNSKAASADRAVKAVKLNEANVLMKGNIHTSVLMKAVLNKDIGLRTGRILSHVAVFEIPGFERFMIVTDSALNIAPDLEKKAQIITNAVGIARSIGIEIPRVAPVAAVEVINPAMPATIDAAALSAMNKRGQLPDCIVDGPLALDNAISLAAANHKGIKSDVAGCADILLMPEVEAGNILYKSLIYFAKAKAGSIIAGAKAPIVLTSRADSAESRLYSIALAICSL